MPRVSAAFFAVGVLCVLTGMFWGLYMGRLHDIATAPAHAHLNLIGWVTMAIYGGFYALQGDRMQPKLAWANFGFSTLGVIIMVPSFALFLSHGYDPEFAPYLLLGAGLSILGAVIFGISVFRELFRRRA